MREGKLVKHTPESAPANDAHSNSHFALKKAERERRDKVFLYSPETGAEWLEATKGQPITPEQFQRLEGKYTSYTVEEILAVFDDWDDYLANCALAHDARQEEKAKAQKVLIEQIHQEYENGIIPGELFWAAKEYVVDNPEPDQEPLTRITLIKDVPADPEVLIDRYYTYKLARHVMRKHPRLDSVGDPVFPEESELINIALGFDTSTGQPGKASSLTQLRGNRRTKNADDVKLAIDDLGLESHFYPQSRKGHLLALVQTGNGKPQNIIPRPESKPRQKEEPKNGAVKNDVEYYFDIDQRIVVGIGRSALSEFISDEEERYLKLLSKLGKLTLFESTSQKSQNLIPMEQALKADLDTSDLFKKPPKGLYIEMVEADYISYGKWLTRFMDTPPDGSRKMAFAGSKIKKAHRLGIGPSRYQITTAFNEITNFYLAINVKDARHQNLYTSWTRQDYITYGRTIAYEASVDEPRLTKEALWQAGRDRKGPSPEQILATGLFKSMNEYYQACEVGGPPPRKDEFEDWSLQNYIDYIRLVAEENGGRPEHDAFLKRTRSGKKEPTLYAMARKFDNKQSGISLALELAGYAGTRSWDNDDDYLNWGVRFMLHNDGLVPTALSLKTASKRYLGPAQWPIRMRFKNIRNYQELVRARYDELVLTDGLVEENLLPRFVKEFISKNKELIKPYTANLRLAPDEIHKPMPERVTRTAA